MQGWSNGLVKKLVRGVDVETWWVSSLRPLPRDQRRHVAALLMYTAWNIWKETNRRVFEGQTMTTLLVPSLHLYFGVESAANGFECTERLVVPMLALFLVEFECFQLIDQLLAIHPHQQLRPYCQ